MSDLKLGYNTCGFARTNNLLDIVRIIRTLGYDGIELTLGKEHFHPLLSGDLALHQLSWQIATHKLDFVLNTGGRYVLGDIPHEPSLVSASKSEREQFVQFVSETIRIAPVMGTKIVMLHSGSLPEGVDRDDAWMWLVNGLVNLTDLAERKKVILAFEFHPEMFISCLDDYWRLKQFVKSAALKLTLDVGHVVCTDGRPVSQVIAECKSEIVNVHLEDIRGRKHVHLPIGQGDVDFADVFCGLKAIDYKGLINIEYNTNDLEVDECQLARETFSYLRHMI